MYSEFLDTGFRNFEREYYQHWLHTDQIVSIENGVQKGRIVGVNLVDGGSGGLMVECEEGGGMVEVVADGNSFDMMRGLLRKKR
jgi:biotin---protein ligase